MDFFGNITGTVSTISSPLGKVDTFQKNNQQQQIQKKSQEEIHSHNEPTRACPLVAYHYGDLLAQSQVNGALRKMLPALQQIHAQALAAIKQIPLLQIRRADGHHEGVDNVIPLLETTTSLVWVRGHWGQGPNSVSSRGEVTLTDYTLPLIAEMQRFCHIANVNHPWRSGSNCRLWSFDLFQCQEGRVDLDSAALVPNTSYPDNRHLACNLRFKNDLPALLVHLLQHGYQLQPPGSTADDTDLLKLLRDIHKVIIESLRNLDSVRAPLPKLDDLQLTEKGLWELHGETPELLHQLGLRARNPELDIKDWPITIDFGTSSTVVAYNEQLQAKLFRVGVKDYFNKAQPRDYENPTLLQIDDLQAVLGPWQSEAYRPEVKWGDVFSAHEAHAKQRDNEGDSDLTASLLGKLKQWALREVNDMRIHFKDRLKQYEYELPLLTERFPAKNQPLTVSPADPFDPIELYAYFLGLSVNWRQRGLFLKYYMSFPVDYPIAVKNRVRASFSRGLQRSLPATLLQSERFSEFEVTELASEPAAFAAAALPYFKIEPDQTGIHYGVFDFGGGTTDFDFGLYRQATEEEEDSEGFEYAFEHFGACGDRFLGGENLLENLAYRVLVHEENLLQCRTNRIAFTKPLDANPFEGCELLLESTQAAITNSHMVMTKLRAFWELDQRESNGFISVGLLDREGEPKSIKLKVDYDQLSQYLDERLERGVSNFFTALKNAFSSQQIVPTQLHILLAGNACLSERLQRLFALEPSNVAPQRFSLEPVSGTSQPDSGVTRLRTWLASQLPNCELLIYPPIPQNPANPYQPTTKTGVALGLLNLTPGKGVKVVNHSAKTSRDGEAPFGFSVGRIRRRQYCPMLKPHATYGKWHELGVVSQGGFVLVFSNDPNADGMAGDSPELRSKTLSFNGHTQDHRLYARVISPSEIECVTAVSLEAVQRHDVEHQSRIKLSMA